MDPITAAIGLASTFAPSIVRWIAGDKAGEVADKVVSIAQTITGTSDTASAQKVLSEKPELVFQFQTQMAGLNVDMEKAYLVDRQSARARDIELHKAGYRNTRADIMLVMAFLSLVTILILVYFGRLDMPGEVVAILNMSCGALLKMLGDAFAFEFGSSRSSKEKDALLSKIYSES